MTLIAISARQLADIKVQSEQAYPQECCGLLVGRLNDDGFLNVTRVVPSPNMSKSNTADTFEVDAKVRFDVMRAVEGSDEDIIGHYHSHPDHPPEPSATDLDMAFEPEFVWLITSLSKGQAGETKAWRLNQDTRTTQALTLLVIEDG